LAFPDATVARQLQQSGVPIRAGTRRRWPFARFVNIHNNASRKASGRHEAWHGMDLALSMHPAPGLNRPGLRIPDDAWAWQAWGELHAEPWSAVADEVKGASEWIVPGRRHIILHAGSNNSATNWPLERYVASMEAFLNSGCRVLWTGTAAEGEPLNEVLHSHKDVVNTTGKLSLHQLLSLISACNGLIASSTGPLHMAAGLGMPCTGLYAAEAPMWPERWHPLGAQAQWEATTQRTASGHLDVAVDGVVNRFLNLWGLPPAQ
jgi:ADP-heptose:LPS heptosyltransferase